MPFAQNLLLVIYYAFLAIVAIVMLYRGLLIVRYARRPKEDEQPRGRFPAEPTVTVQLPIYNERFVAERLVEAACLLDWPRDRLEVQVLDDSTDDTAAITARKVKEMRARGFDVKHVRRVDRSGYKAGALREALPAARGDFLAVFDADFVPRRDFLRRTMDHFTDPEVGFVQGRWDYLNREYGWLTQGMGMLMDGHFVLEQVTRSRGGFIFNFNGTAGVWRREAIRAAGGWSDDTICEDTDLSYRAHLAGYRGVYLKQLPVPCELPVQITALKTQQHRWSKGLTECFLKLMPALWRSPMRLGRKLEGTLHLGATFAFPASLFLTVIALPVMTVRAAGAAQGALAAAVDSVVLLLMGVSQILFYVVTTRELHRDWLRRMRWLPFFPIVGVGLAVNNARGVLEALTGLRTEFVRTPKLGVLRRDRRLVRTRERTYTGGRHLYQALVEIGLGIYYVFMALMQWPYLQVAAFFTGVLSLGLFTMGGATLRALWLKSQREAEARAALAAGRAPARAARPASWAPTRA